MKTLVLHYSRTGNNRYLAERTAATLEADIEGIRPRINLFPCLLSGTWLGFGTGIRKLAHKPEDYHCTVVFAPLWIGKFALPAQSLLRKYSGRMNSICIATCCGSTDKNKADKFGYEGAFQHIRKLAGGKCVYCEAFPIGMVIPEEQKDDSQSFMKTRLSNDNFKGEILERFKCFISEVRGLHRLK